MTKATYKRKCGIVLTFQHVSISKPWWQEQLRAHTSPQAGGKAHIWNGIKSFETLKPILSDTSLTRPQLQIFSKQFHQLATKYSSL